MNRPELIKTHEKDFARPVQLLSEAQRRQADIDAEKEAFFARGGKVQMIGSEPVKDIPPINEFTGQPDKSREVARDKHNKKQKAEAQATEAFYSGKQRPRPNRKSNLPVNIRKCKNFYTVDIRDVTRGRYPPTTEGLIEAIKDRNKTRALLMMCPIVESGWWDAHL